MHALTALLAAEHLRDLQAEADASRRSRAWTTTGPQGPALWRRVLGRGARGLSLSFGWLASRLDPEDRRTRPAAA
jgi:hypothetical protein